MKKKQAAAATVAALLVLIGFWIEGFDFNLRGGHALTAYIAALIASAFGWLLAGEHLKQSQ